MTILLRRNTEAGADTNNVVLALGEPGYDETNRTLAVGDGVSTWKRLLRLGRANIAPIIADNSTDNYAAIMGALNSLPATGGTVRLVSSATGNKVAVSSDIILPAGATLEFETRSTKLGTDESTGIVLVPHSTYTPTVIATDNVGGTLASAGANTYTLTRTSGTWPAAFVPGLAVSLVGAAGGAAVPTNCRIFSKTSTVLTLTGGCTGGTCTGLTGVWGSLVVAAGDHSKLRRVSADAGTVARCAIIGSGFRNELDSPDAHGGTFAALYLPNNGVASPTNQPILLNPNSENYANKSTTYVRQYGPYSAVFEQGDIQMTGGRLIAGTKAFVRGSGGAQVMGTHFTEATKSGPNIELGAIIEFTNIGVDVVGGNGTCMIEHLTPAQNFGFTAGHSTIMGCIVFPDGSVAVPLLLEGSGISGSTSVSFRDVFITANGNTLSCLAQNPNADTEFENVTIMSTAFAAAPPAALPLFTGGPPGRALNIKYNDGTTTTRLDGTGSYIPASATTALVAGSDVAVATTGVLYEGTYRFDAKAMCSGSTAAVSNELYVGPAASGPATLASYNGAGAGLSNATAGNQWTLAADGSFTVTAAGAVSLYVHAGAGITGSAVANKAAPLTGKNGATVLALQKTN